MEKAEYERMFAVEDTHWWFVARRLFVEKILAHLGIQKAEKLRNADIGAGTGGMVRFLEQYGKVVGIEPNPLGRKLAKRRRIRLKQGSAEHTGILSGSQDMVCFFDVLYHKRINEKKALAEAWRIVKPGGFLIITDCAFQFLYGPHDVFVEGKKRYSISHLARNIHRSGFRVTYATYTFFLVFPVFATWRLIERLMWYVGLVRPTSSDVSPVSPFLNTILVWLCAMEAKLIGYLAFPWGSSVLIFAQKPTKA